MSLHIDHGTAGINLSLRCTVMGKPSTIIIIIIGIHISTSLQH